MKTADENEGHGGSYIVEKDGTRKLVERTEEPKQTTDEPPAPSRARLK